MISDDSLLDIWEHGWAKLPFQRAMLILEAAYPEYSPESLLKLSIGQRDALLLAVYAQQFGDQIRSLASCPKCSEQMEFDTCVSNLISDYQDPTTSTVLLVDDLKIQCRLPTTFDLDHLLRNEDRVHGRSLLVQCITNMEAETHPFCDADLSDDHLSRIQEWITESDALCNIEFELACSACESQWTSHFDILTYLWTKVDQSCRRIASDIHALAQAYGWGEQEVLKLSRWRRQVYLNMVQP